MTARTPAILAAGVVLLLQTFDPEPAALSRTPDKPSGLLPGSAQSDSAASIGKYVSGHIDEFATPEFYARQKMRRDFQRSGYVNILHDVLGLDAVSALLSFVRTRLQIEYSLPHNTIYFRTDTGALWPLPEEWEFPADPWTD